MNKVLKLIATVIACSLIWSLANAALVPRLGGQAVYDTDLNLTWLADANLANSNSFGVAGILTNGVMDWNTAQQWIAAVNAANYLGYNDWRLPATAQPDLSCATQSSGFGLGYDCQQSELGHLFYVEWAGTHGTNGQTGTATIGNIPAFQLFSNVQRLSLPATYWTSTTFNSSNVWTFNFADASQGLGNVNSLFYAWAVRDGDVVPIPAAAWLFGSALGLLGWLRRR